MIKTLNLAPGLSLPLDAVTRRLAILAMSGAGKSNTAVVMAEAMFAAGIPWVAIDPKGDWWGVRSDTSGKGPGLSIPIFGGLHGDVPLEPSAGALIGELIVDQRMTCVLDVSEFPDRQQLWKFLIDLGETLLRRNRDALHLFLEEADEYLPQSTKDKGNLPQCLGVWQRVVKRGRFRGIGSTQITQRSASLNKDTLYQCEAIIAMRVTGKGDRAAIKGWVEHHNAADEIVNSLSTLQDGEGWLSSPAWLRRTERIQFPKRHTYDSGATPVSLKGKATTATLADIDLDALRVRMADAFDEAKANDPKELKKQIVELRKALSESERKHAALTDSSTKQPPAKISPALTDADRTLLEKTGNALLTLRDSANTILLKADERLTTRVETAVRDYLDSVGSTALQVGEELTAHLDRASVKKLLDKLNALTTEKPANESRQNLPMEPVGRLRALASEAASVNSGANYSEVIPKPSQVPQDQQVADGQISGVGQRILNALAELAALGAKAPVRELVATLAGYGSVNTKTFSNTIGALRTAGYIDYPQPGLITLTPAGRAVAVTPKVLSTPDDVQARVIGILGETAGKVLRPLCAVYPQAMARDDVAARAGYGSVNTKTFSNVIGRLRTLGFIDYPQPGTIKACGILFLQEE